MGYNPNSEIVLVSKILKEYKEVVSFSINVGLFKEVRIILYGEISENTQGAIICDISNTSSNPFWVEVKEKKYYIKKFLIK